MFKRPNLFGFGLLILVSLPYTYHIMRNLFLLFALFIYSSQLLFAQTKLNATDFVQAYEKQKKAQLIDVRTSDEYQAGHISKAQNINWSDRAAFDETTKKLNKKNPVFVYCLSGGRSAKAAEALTAQGFQVFELQGGYLSYQQLHDTPAATKDKGLSVNDFEAIKTAQHLVLVDFTATWCGPCQEIKPLLVKVEKDKSLGIKVVYIDADANKDLLKTLAVQAIPRLQLFKAGKLVWDYTGSIDEQTLTNELKKHR